jgi:hypothetical protein
LNLLASNHLYLYLFNLIFLLEGASLKHKRDRSLRFKLKKCMCEITWAVLGWGWPARLLEDGAGTVDGSAVHLRGVQAACGGRELDMLRALQVSTGQKEWWRPMRRFSYFEELLTLRNSTIVGGEFICLCLALRVFSSSAGLCPCSKLACYRMTNKSPNKVMSHCKKGQRISRPPSRDVTYQTLPDGEEFNYSRAGRVW